jgi:uncharacterized protein GlcG (DUF336 family)
MQRNLEVFAGTILCFTLAIGCGGSGGGSGRASAFLGGSGMPGVANLRVCDGTCALNAAQAVMADPTAQPPRSLNQAQVATILQQAAAEAQARGVGATIAIVDRVGNVLAVSETLNPPAPQTINIGSNPAAVNFPGNGLEDVPGGVTQGTADVATAADAALSGSNPTLLLAAPISARLAAISKAITAAYLSTEGNAFTTESASQIIQENFNPGEGMRIGGPLFGVQFSQLVCDDITRRQSIVSMAQGTAGPKSAPIGFSGDPGGIPLYIAGEMVGGIGIESDGVYSVQTNIIGGRTFVTNESLIALAGQRSFEPNDDREANKIFVDGRSLRYVDAEGQPLLSPAAPALVSPAIAPANAPLVDVRNFFQASGGIRAGTEFLRAQSGYMPITSLGGVPFTGAARMFVNMDMSPYLGQNVYDPTANATAVTPVAVTPNPRPSVSPTPANGGLTMEEAATIVAGGIGVARRAKALIRRGIQGPGLPFMEVNVSVVDLAGNLLAFAGTPDAPVFGSAVSVQKARASAFFSRQGGEDPALPGSAAAAMMADAEPVFPIPGLMLKFQTQEIGQYVTDTRRFLAPPDGTMGPNSDAFANGLAFADRSIGNLARPLFPDGINGTPNGPLSKPITSWSPFNTGIQLDLILNRLLVGLFLNQEGGANPIQATCTGPTLLTLRGGIQIFPGSVAIYKNGKLVGGMGISGDGVDQDDLIAFQGLKEAGIALGGTGVGAAGVDPAGDFLVGNAPRAVRADQIRVPGFSDDSGNLRYVNCPANPFVNSSEQNVCERGDM